MSKGISWRQRCLLKSLLRLEERYERKPVSWHELDWGISEREKWHDPERERDHRRWEWNREQAKRRALRNLEARGLVRLGRYVFAPEAGVREEHPHYPRIDLDDHVPGQTRIAVGVRLSGPLQRGAQMKEANSLPQFGGGGRRRLRRACAGARIAANDV
jgi:hypothetical protein